MHDNRAVNWLMGRTPAMEARQERTARYPVLTAIAAGLTFAIGMSFAMAPEYGALGVVAALIEGALFGPLLVALTLRRVRRRGGANRDELS